MSGNLLCDEAERELGTKTKLLASKLLREDRCAAPDQISFVPTFPWIGLILTMRNGHRTDENELALFRFGVTTKDFRHLLLLYGFTADQRLSW
jgi:hypothetical protein